MPALALLSHGIPRPLTLTEHVLPGCRDKYPLYKTRMCTFFQEGRCRAGPACLHAHSIPELQEGLAAAAGKSCKNFVEQGRCPFPQCPFSHALPAKPRC